MRPGRNRDRSHGKWSAVSPRSTKLGVNEFLLLSKGESKDIGRARQYILANAYEALVGAIFLDQGYPHAREFIAGTLFDLTDEIVAKKLWQDAKSRFQEMAQEHANVTPSYKTLREEGPDHNREFTVGVYLKNELIAEGLGKAKQEAEQEAAEKGLAAKGW